MISEEQKKKNRAEYCKHGGDCDGLCIVIGRGTFEPIRCEHFIKSSYEWFGATLDATMLKSRPQYGMEVFGVETMLKKVK